MTKRSRSAAFTASDILVEAMAAFDAPSQSLYQFALPPMPGQWETIYVPGDTNAPPAIFPSSMRWVLPMFTNIKDFFNFAYHFVERHTWRQYIEPVPVIRPDGARKKVLLDAGTVRERKTSNHKAQRATGRRTHTHVRKTSPQSIRQKGVRGTQNVRQDVAPKHHPAMSGLTGVASIPGSYPNIPHNPPPSTSPNNVALGMGPSLLRTNQGLNFATSFGASNDTTLDSMDISFENCLHSTPRADASYNSLSGASMDSNTRVKRIPVSRHRQAKPIGFCDSLVDVDRKLTAPVLEKAPLHPRIQALSNSKFDHTNRDSQIHLLSGTPTLKVYIQSPGIKNEVVRVATRAQKENEDYETMQQSKGQNEEELVIDYIFSPSRSLQGIGDQQQFFSSFLSEDLNELPANNEYSNDLSHLPDAPPLKSVRIQTAGKTKSFYKDAAACELLNSELTLIITSPHKTSHGEDEHIDESTLSEEIVEDFKQVLGLSVTSDKASQLLPQQVRPPSKPPLVAPLTTEEQQKLAIAVGKTNNGARHVNLVKDLLSTYDFKTLLPTLFDGNPKAWLNDNIVNEYLKLLVDYEKAMAGYEHVKDGPAPPVHAFPSQWFTTMTKNPQSVRRWASRMQLGGKQLLDVKLLLIPICDGGHWRLLAIQPQERTIQLLDSMHANHKTFVEKAEEWLQSELKEHYIKSEWKLKGLKESAEQLNGSDCGVFTCLNALALLRDESISRVIADDGMMSARERIAISLLNGKQTGELD